MIDEARTISELRDLLLKIQPLLEKVSRFADRSGTQEQAVCIPLNNEVSAHLIALEGGTLGVLFVRGDHAPGAALALTPEPV